MVNIQLAAINESAALTDDREQPASPALKNQLEQDFAPACAFEHFEQILCCYGNATSFIQIARIAKISNRDFERVIFPGERLLFEALPDAQLEIHTCIRGTAILSDKILCKHLRVSLQ